MNQERNALTKRNHLFQKWVTKPTDFNRDAYRNQHNSVASVTRNAREEVNSKKLGIDAFTRTILRKLKNQKRSSQPRKKES